MPGPETRQYLTFSLAGEEYGVDILKVQEIRGWSPITPIPNMPSFLKGVMNLRGTVVPVVDLRVKLGMSEVVPSAFTVIIVVRVGSRATGLLVDAVSDVLSIGEADVEQPPDFGVLGPSVLKGTARIADKLVVLLDIDSVLASGEPLPREAVS
jgi:purine-binding chemotaxis protein CheW